MTNLMTRNQGGRPMLAVWHFERCHAFLIWSDWTTTYLGTNGLKAVQTITEILERGGVKPDWA